MSRQHVDGTSSDRQFNIGISGRLRQEPVLTSGSQLVVHRSGTAERHEADTGQPKPEPRGSTETVLLIGTGSPGMAAKPASSQSQFSWFPGVTTIRFMPVAAHQWSTLSRYFRPLGAGSDPEVAQVQDGAHIIRGSRDAWNHSAKPMSIAVPVPRYSDSRLVGQREIQALPSMTGANSTRVEIDRYPKRLPLL